MPHWITAHCSDGSQILGNLDGQSIIRTRRPKSDKLWVQLDFIRVSLRVHHWNLENNSGVVIATKLNPNFKEA